MNTSAFASEVVIAWASLHAYAWLLRIRISAAEINIGLASASNKTGITAGLNHAIKPKAERKDEGKQQAAQHDVLSHFNITSFPLTFQSPVPYKI